MMERGVSRWIFDHWQRKGVALITALIIWLFVNHSITDTKTIPNIAIKVINLPSDKAVIGLLPNGLLSRRVTLTLSGTKNVIADLEAGDIEVVLDASAVDRDEWLVTINKKNLVSLNPAINLAHHITQVEHGEFILKLSHLITARIPVTVLPPIGQAPPGYRFVDVWPQELWQTISGPEEEVEQIQNRGLQLRLDLNRLTKMELDALAAHDGREVLFFVPAKWKRVDVSLQGESEEELNDPQAKYLHLAFLQQEWLPIEGGIEARVYYPLKTLSSLNPESHPLGAEGKVTMERGIALLKLPLYTVGVSRLFLDAVRGSLEIAVLASNEEERPLLQWSLEVIGAERLENAFIALLKANEQHRHAIPGDKGEEELFRRRFRHYLTNLTLYQYPEQPLYLECVRTLDSIEIK